MDSTPPRSKLSCKGAKLTTGVKRGESSDSPQQTAGTTSNNQPIDQETDYSPIYFPSTQEASDDIDVLWDWHSPQTSQKRRKKQKRLLPIQSPKNIIRRHPSNNNQNQNLEKLRDELRALKEELALPDDESCLCVSPQQEMEFKQLENNLVLKKEQEQQLAQFDDMFDDSIDEQLLLFSQKIEKDLERSIANGAKENEEDSLSRICDNSDINNLINKYSTKSLGCDKMTTNDSFDLALKNFYIEDRNKRSNIGPTQKNILLQRSVSDHKFCDDKTNTMQTISGKVEFHRTKSFELEAVKHSQINLPKCTLEEIERKRLEAKARLEAKKKLSCTSNTKISPTKCSPEEIEKKRLQALAKREAKRLQEIVEKNRQEALKRLQITRMKKANLVKSTLTKRL